MKEIYKASGQVNGTMFIGYEGPSKREVIQAIRKSTESNRYEGHTSRWTVYRNSDGAAVAAGGMDSFGRRYRLSVD